MNNDIYTLSQPVSVMYISNKYPRVDNILEAYFWHCRLGHINKKRINKLIKERILKVDGCESLPIYKSYFLEKMTKSPFTRKGERACEVLSLVHTDVHGSTNISVRDGYYYFITFTDDLSRYGYVYLKI